MNHDAGEYGGTALPVPGPAARFQDYDAISALAVRLGARLRLRGGMADSVGTGALSGSVLDRSAMVTAAGSEHRPKQLISTWTFTGTTEG
jgi:hypothetical protein